MQCSIYYYHSFVLNYALTDQDLIALADVNVPTVGIEGKNFLLLLLFL